MQEQQTDQSQNSEYKIHARLAEETQLPIFTLEEEKQQGDNGGWLLKWRILIEEENRHIWIKLPGNIIDWMEESYAEVLASAICKDFRLNNYTKYYPCVVTYKGERILACFSYDFCEQNNEKLVTIQRLLESKDKSYDYNGIQHYKSLLRFIKKTTKLNIKYQMEDIIFLDYLICNFDRSYNNFGVLANNSKQFRLAPIFDSGASFDLWKSGYGEFDRDLIYAEGDLPYPFKVKFEQQLDLIRTNRQYKSDFFNFKEKLRWFEMNCSEKNNTYNVVNPLSEDRVCHIKSMVEKNYAAFQEYKQNK